MVVTSLRLGLVWDPVLSADSANWLKLLPEVTTIIGYYLVWSAVKLLSQQTDLVASSNPVVHHTDPCDHWLQILTPTNHTVRFASSFRFDNSRQINFDSDNFCIFRWLRKLSPHLSEPGILSYGTAVTFRSLTICWVIQSAPDLYQLVDHNHSYRMVLFLAESAQINIKVTVSFNRTRLTLNSVYCLPNTQLPQGSHGSLKGGLQLDSTWNLPNY